MLKGIRNLLKKSGDLIVTYVLKEGIVATLALILSGFSLWLQFDSKQPKLDGGVRNVIKSQATWLNEYDIRENYTLYALYIQITNIGKVPVDVNMIAVEAFQNNKMQKLVIKSRLNQFIDSMGTHLVEDIEKLKAHQILRNSVIDPGKSIEGYYLCLGKPEWSLEYTEKFTLHCWDKLDNEFILNCDMLQDNATLPFELVQERTGVRFKDIFYKEKPN